LPVTTTGTVVIALWYSHLPDADTLNRVFDTSMEGCEVAQTSHGEQAMFFKRWRSCRGWVINSFESESMATNSLKNDKLGINQLF
jgi:hypothetical protein